MNSTDDMHEGQDVVSVQAVQDNAEHWVKLMDIYDYGCEYYSDVDGDKERQQTANAKLTNTTSDDHGVEEYRIG